MALRYLAVASPLILACFVRGGRWAETAFAVLAVAFPLALIVLGVRRRDGVGPLRAPLLALLLILEASTMAVLALRGRVIDAPWLGGLPLSVAVAIYGLWLVPLALTVLAFALTFDSFFLRDEDLRRLRRRGTERDEPSGR